MYNYPLACRIQGVHVPSAIRVWSPLCPTHLIRMHSSFPMASLMRAIRERLSARRPATRQLARCADYFCRVTVPWQKRVVFARIDHAYIYAPGRTRSGREEDPRLRGYIGSPSLCERGFLQCGCRMRESLENTFVSHGDVLNRTHAVKSVPCRPREERLVGLACAPEAYRE